MENGEYNKEAFADSEGFLVILSVTVLEIVLFYCKMPLRYNLATVKQYNNLKLLRHSESDKRIIRY